MSYTERLRDRLGVVSVKSAANTAAATGATSDSIDMKEYRQVQFLLVGAGTGTAGITVQEGSVSHTINPTTGEVTASSTSWENLTWDGTTNTDGDTGTITATGVVTNGQCLPIEVIDEAVSGRYLRALVNTKTAQTYATLVALATVARRTPVTHSSDTKEHIEIGFSF